MTEETNLKNLDFNMSKHFTLSMRLSTEQFAFSIFNPLNEEPMVYLLREVDKDLSMPANVKQLLRTNSFLNHPFSRVNVIMDTNRYTLVPFELFEDEQATSLFYSNLSHNDTETEEVKYNILPKTNAVVLFGMDKLIDQLLSDEYSNLHFFCQMSPLTEYFTNKSFAGNTRKLYAYIKETSIDLFCINRGKLLLINSFRCRSTEDVLYYLLFAWKQMKFDQEHDELNLVGNIHDKQTITDRLQQFINQIYFINPKSELANLGGNSSNEVPFDLQTLKLCEL